MLFFFGVPSTFLFQTFAFLLAGTMEPASAEVLFPNRKNPCNF